jgi:hypothetical protein
VNERELRIVKNEEMFRAVNERIEDIHGRLGIVTGEQVAEFVCECGDASCVERAQIELAEYERVRSNGHWFFVLPGHAIPDVETIVGHGDGYLVVEKDAEAQSHAHEVDERSGPPAD